MKEQIFGGTKFLYAGHGSLSGLRLGNRDRGFESVSCEVRTEFLYIISTEICSNGVIYLTDKVYSPSEFTSVIAPVTFNDNATIVQKGIKDANYPFDVYLNSMVNQFSFFAYTDDVLTTYINPASIDGRPVLRLQDIC